ncbi:unnamed protein product [Brassica rapa]|uniref:PGG domain-containing protein n=1 Tax=Brassica campestris TaxID=3711 RepID=A0A8D9MCF7_BRACM|nr:unnamed protein product [Brassica rapa]
MQPIFKAIIQNDIPAFLGLVEEKESWLEERNVDQDNSTVLHMAAKHGHGELVSKIIELKPSLIFSRNAHGNTPLHLAALLGEVNTVRTLLEFGSETCSARNNSCQTPLHLVCRSISTESARLFAEKTHSVSLDELKFSISKRLSINNQKLMRQVDVNGNTVLHIAVSMSCGAPLLRYIVGKKIIDINCKNNMGFTAFDLLPQEAEDFELLSTLSTSRLGTMLDSDQSIEEQGEHSNPYNKGSQEGVKSLDIPESLKENEVIRLLRLIETNTSKIAHIKRNKKGAVERDRRSLEREMHIEALQNARNTIAIVAVLIASVSYAGGINPPGGVYDDGPWRGKSIVGNTTPFKVFAICNNIALFTSLCIVILLVSIIPYKRKPLKRLLVITHRMMWVSVGFMATAYVAASWVTIPLLRGTRWLFPAIVSIAGGSLMVLFSYLGVETIGHWFKKMNRVGDIPVYFMQKWRVRDIPPISRRTRVTSPDHSKASSFARTNSDLAASENSGYFTY